MRARAESLNARAMLQTYADWEAAILITNSNVHDITDICTCTATMHPCTMLSCPSLPAGAWYKMWNVDSNTPSGTEKTPCCLYLCHAMQNRVEHTYQTLSLFYFCLPSGTTLRARTCCFQLLVDQQAPILYSVCVVSADG